VAIATAGRLRKPRLLRQGRKIIFQKMKCEAQIFCQDIKKIKKKKGEKNGTT